MSTATIPIATIKAESDLGASWSVVVSIPGWVRKPISLWLIPKALRVVNRALTNDRLGAMTLEEASELYPALSGLLYAGKRLIRTVNSGPPFVRVMLSPLMLNISKELEVLEDNVEALAWGSHAPLRSFVKAAIAEILTTREDHNIGMPG